MLLRISKNGDLYYTQKMHPDAKISIENWENIEENKNICWIDMELGQDDWCTASLRKLSDESIQTMIKENENAIDSDTLSASYSFQCPRCRKIARYLSSVSTSGTDRYTFICNDCKMEIYMVEYSG